MRRVVTNGGYGEPNTWRGATLNRSLTRWHLPTNFAVRDGNGTLPY